MARKPRSPFSERNTGPIPWQDFVLGFEIANHALESLAEPVVKPPFLRPTPNPGQSDPYRWVAIAVTRHFGRDYPHLANLQYRFWALLQLLDGGGVDEWVMPGDETTSRRLHPALLLAAAEVRLTRNAKFPARRFAARVKEIIRTEVESPAEVESPTGEDEGTG